ncbi:MAG: hypothetical protein AAF611_08780 [Bacteroidota bacterium]
MEVFLEITGHVTFHMEIRIAVRTPLCTPAGIQIKGLVQIKLFSD